MKHLTPPELIEAAEHSAPPARMTHVEACRTCATAVAELRAALGDARLAADVPEPSPLFWDHFSARVKDATSGEPVPHPRWWAGVWRPVFAVAGLAAVAVVGWSVLATPGALDVPDVGTQASVELPGIDDLPELPEAWEIDAEAWTAVTSVAGQVGVEGVRTLVPPSGAGLLDDLNTRELQEFARLLRAEMGGVQ
jgi:hypothetical protein